VADTIEELAGISEKLQADLKKLGVDLTALKTDLENFVGQIGRAEPRLTSILNSDVELADTVEKLGNTGERVGAALNLLTYGATEMWTDLGTFADQLRRAEPGLRLIQSSRRAIRQPPK
jgi:hypothetical protein